MHLKNVKDQEQCHKLININNYAMVGGANYQLHNHFMNENNWGHSSYIPHTISPLQVTMNYKKIFEL